jgi:hypothetical protein
MYLLNFLPVEKFKTWKSMNGSYTSYNTLDINFLGFI